MEQANIVYQTTTQSGTKIELVDRSTVALVQHIGDDRMVAGAAWVSVSGQEALDRIQDTTKDIGPLINFLMSKRHGTPFEHNCMTFFVDAPIFVWREFHRHRIGWSYNETSGRYKKLEPRFWVVPASRLLVPEPGYKATAPKFVKGTPEQVEYVRTKQASVYATCYSAYEDIAKEVARTVLPVATMSQCWCTCNARSMMSYLSLRTHDPEATFPSFPQAEIEEAARQMEILFANMFPITYETWCKNGRVAP